MMQNKRLLSEERHRANVAEGALKLAIAERNAVKNRVTELEFQMKYMEAQAALKECRECNDRKRRADPRSPIPVTKRVVKNE